MEFPCCFWPKGACDFWPKVTCSFWPKVASSFWPKVTCSFGQKFPSSSRSFGQKPASFWPKAGFFLAKRAGFWPERSRLLARRAGFWPKKPAFGQIRPYGPYYTVILGQRPYGPYYTVTKARRAVGPTVTVGRCSKLHLGTHGNTGIHGNTGNTGNQGIQGAGESRLFWPKPAGKALFCALRAQKQLNQVVLDSPDPVRAGSGDGGAGSGVHYAGSVSSVDGSGFAKRDGFRRP